MLADKQSIRSKLTFGVFAILCCAAKADVADACQTFKMASKLEPITRSALHFSVDWQYNVTVSSKSHWYLGICFRVTGVAGICVVKANKKHARKTQTSTLFHYILLNQTCSAWAWTCCQLFSTDWMQSVHVYRRPVLYNLCTPSLSWSRQSFWTSCPWLLCCWTCFQWYYTL